MNSDRQQGTTSRLRGRSASPVSNCGLPLIAFAVLAVGVAGGYGLSRGPAADHPTAALNLGPTFPGSAVALLLETRSTGEMVGRLAVVATFHDRKDRICREVERFGHNGQPDLAGVACRQPGGRWVFEGLARLAPAEVGGTIEPSGTHEKNALASLLTMLGAKAVLGPEAEAALIDRAWQ